MFLADTNEQSSNRTIFSPRLEAVIQSESGSGFSIAAQVDEGNFSLTDVDDYTDWRLDAAATVQLDSRNLLSLSAGMFNTREQRGTGFSQGSFFASTPDEYEDTNLSASYQYGTQGSAGRIVLEVRSYDKSYDNNFITTQFRDREDMNYNAAFYWAVSPRTDIFAEYRTTDVNYKTDPTNVLGAPDSLDSDESYTYVGINWQASAATSGTFKLGYSEKEFTDADRADDRGLSYDLNILWSPLSYSSVNFNAFQGFGEAVGVGNASFTTSYGATWQHSWSDNLTSSLVISAIEDEMVGSARTDDTENLSFRVDYGVKRWLDVYVSATYTDKESSFGIFNFQENAIAIGIDLSL
jgi:hypothetical protein